MHTIIPFLTLNYTYIFLTIKIHYLKSKFSNILIIPLKEYPLKLQIFFIFLFLYV